MQGVVQVSPLRNVYLHEVLSEFRDKEVVKVMGTLSVLEAFQVLAEGDLMAVPVVSPTTDEFLGIIDTLDLLTTITDACQQLAGLGDSAFSRRGSVLTRQVMQKLQLPALVEPVAMLLARKQKPPTDMHRAVSPSNPSSSNAGMSPPNGVADGTRPFPGAGRGSQQPEIDEGDDIAYTPTAQDTLYDMIESGFLGGNNEHSRRVYRIPILRGQESGEAVQATIGGRIQHLLSPMEVMLFLNNHKDLLGSFSEQTIPYLEIEHKELVTVKFSSPAMHGLMIMREKNQMDLPVVSAEGKLVGTFGAADLRGFLPDDFALLKLTIQEFLSIMQTRHRLHNLGKVPFCTDTATLGHIVEVMATHRAPHVYVVNPQHQPIRIISQYDVLKALIFEYEALPAMPKQKLGYPAIFSISLSVSTSRKGST